MRGLLLLVMASFLCGGVAAQAPSTLSYQGYLTTPASGAPVNGMVAMSFRIYAAAGGMPLYTENQNITVTNGLFDVVIGSVVPLTLPFDAQYYLGIAVGADPEMQPRQPFTSVGSAFLAAAASSLKCNGCITASELAPGVAPAGPPGANGLNSLVAMTNEPAGVNCAYGGTKVTSGLDLNASGTLDAGEVSATRYVCNGSPYAVVPTVPPGCGTQPLTLGTPAYVSPAGVGGLVYKGEVVTFAVNVTDPNTCSSVAVANNFIWTVVSRPLGSSATLSSTTSPSPALVADIAGGSYQLSVQVIDTLGNKSPTAFVSVNVSACGAQAPVIAAVNNPSSVYTSTSSQLGLQVSSPDNQNGNPAAANYCPPRFAKTFAYSWSILSAPAGGNAQLSSSISPAPNFVSGTVAGAYVVNAVATDSAGFSSPAAAIPITVNLCGTAPLTWPPSNAITLSSMDPDPFSPAGQINVGGQVQLTPNVNNPNVCNGAPVTNSFQWALVAAPSGSTVMLISNNAGLAQFVPDRAGTYQFQVVATDSLGNTSARYFALVTTSTCGANPVVVAAQAAGFAPPAGTVVGNPINVTASTANDIGLVGGSAQSADNSPQSCPSRFAQSFSYAWSMVNAPPGTTAQLTNVNGTTTTFLSGTVPGYYQVQVVAHTGSGLSSSPSFVFFKLN